MTSLSKWGYREIRIEAGIGLIRGHHRPYRASSDLLAIAGTVAPGIESDGTWRLGEPETGQELNSGWLRAGEPGETQRAARSVTGCVTLRGHLAVPSGDWFSFILLYLAEAGPGAAGVIARAAGPGHDGSFSAVGAAAGQVRAVLISRSARQGAPGAETPASLERFRQLLQDALTRPRGRQAAQLGQA